MLSLINPIPPQSRSTHGDWLFVRDAEGPSTPGGQRQTYGSSLQWQADCSNWFEMINAARYDAFDLEGEGVSHSGTRISPNTNGNHN